MLSDAWKTRVEPALATIGRDLGDLAREAKQFFFNLNTSEKLVLVSLFLIGLFVLLLKHFQSQEDGEQAGGRFAGFLFLIASVAAALGWMASGQTA